MTGRSNALAFERMAGAKAWRLTYLAIQGGSSIVLFSALSHLLPAPAFAATAIAQGVIVIVQSIGDFGLSQAAVTVLPTRIARTSDRRVELLSGAATTYLGAACLGAVLTLAVATVVPAGATGPVAVSALATAAVIVVSGADGILRSQGIFRRPVLLMAASELAGFVGLPVAAATHSALWTCTAVALGMSVGSGAAAAVLVRLSRASQRRQIREYVRASVPLGFSQVLIALGTRADTLLAGLVAGLFAGGTFEGSWRVYQLGQYAAGGVASAAAPFIADALGAGRSGDGMRMLRRLLLELLALGIVAGAFVYELRTPISVLLAGGLGHEVARALPALAIVSPVVAVGTAAYYTLIGQDGQRGFVLLAIAVGTVANLTLATILGLDHGARGVVLGCAVGQGLTSVILLTRLVAFVKALTRRRSSSRSPTEPDAEFVRPHP
jgi:O-antigen/teichoic acid export membrane protein